MARKRGGLAGIWDRNKQFITPAAELLGGAVGGPGLAAAIGAGIKGLDRPGKSGIGFDVGQGALGGIEGYGLGAVGAGARAGIGAAGDGIGSKVLGGIKGAIGLGGQAPTQAQNLGGVPDLGAMPNRVGMTGMGGGAAMPSGIANQTVDSLTRGFLPAANAQRSMLGQAGGWLSQGKNLKALGDAAGAGIGAIQQQRYYDLQKRQYDQAEADRKRQQDRESALDPMRAQVFATLASRFGLRGNG